MPHPAAGPLLHPPCRISAALYQMATGGSNSELARLEQEYFISNGAAPNPDLAALLQDPRGTSMLATIPQ